MITNTDHNITAVAGALSRGRVSDTFHKTSTMLGILRKRYSGLSVCHINAQSLPKHLDEFKLSFANANMDIVCVSETWLSSDISDIYIGCNEYEIYRGGRNLRSGGGVALFVNKNIKSKVVQSSAVNSEIEYVFVEIVCGFEKCLVAVIYKPPNVYGSSHIIDILEEITINYNHLIIAGDLNLNLLDENDPPIGNKLCQPRFFAPFPNKHYTAYALYGYKLYSIRYFFSKQASLYQFLRSVGCSRVLQTRFNCSLL